MSETTARERGLQFLGDKFGAAMRDGTAAHIADGSEEFGKECVSWAVDFVFGTVWSRDGIDKRMRSAAVIGMLIALRAHDELRHNVRVALANGVTERELEELLYMAVPYAGMPAASSARRVMKAVLEEIAAEKAAVG